MAQSVFDATLDVNNQIKVNTFDWSHSNNLTTQIGRITPIFCELVPNKGSIRINPRFGLQLMPMVFPVQTPMRARIAFFKYPLRALWKGYRDFVGNFRQGLEEPYIDFTVLLLLKLMGSTRFSRRLSWFTYYYFWFLWNFRKYKLYYCCF